MTPSADLFDFMRAWEGRNGKPAMIAYRDDAGVATIGYGHTAGVKMGDKCTPDQAEQWLFDEVNEFSGVVDRGVQVSVQQCQHDALTSFAYNEGANAFLGSTMLHLINDGDPDAAGLWFPRWIYCGAVKDKGLIRRRAAELRIYEDGDYAGRP